MIPYTIILPWHSAIQLQLIINTSYFKAHKIIVTVMEMYASLLWPKFDFWKSNLFSLWKRKLGIQLVS